MEPGVNRRAFLTILGGGALAGRATSAAAQGVTRQPTIGIVIGLANDATGEGLATAVEPNVGNAGVAVRAGGQGGQGNRLVALAQAHQHPAGFLVAVLGAPMDRILLEEGAARSIGEPEKIEPILADVRENP